MNRVPACGQLSRGKKVRRTLVKASNWSLVATAVALHVLDAKSHNDCSAHYCTYVSSLCLIIIIRTSFSRLVRTHDEYGHLYAATNGLTAAPQSAMLKRMNSRSTQKLVLMTEPFTLRIFRRDDNLELLFEALVD